MHNSSNYIDIFLIIWSNILIYICSAVYIVKSNFCIGIKLKYDPTSGIRAWEQLIIVLTGFNQVIRFNFDQFLSYGRGYCVYFDFIVRGCYLVFCWLIIASECFYKVFEHLRAFNLTENRRIAFAKKISWHSYIFRELLAVFR